MRKTLIVLAVLSMTMLPITAHAGGGGCGLAEHTDLETSAHRADIEIVHGCIVPTILRVEPDTTVRWFSKDGYPHTITSGAGEWAEYELIGDDVFRRTFADEGVFPWYCRYHINMGGAVVVGDPEPDSFVTADPEPVADTSVPEPAGTDATVPLVVLPALAAAGVGFAAGRTRRH